MRFGNTTASLVFGIVFSAVLGLLAFELFYVILSRLLPPQNYGNIAAVLGWAEIGFTAMLGIFAAVVLYESGKFTIELGQKGFFYILGVPLDIDLSVGLGWYIPLLMSVEISSVSALRVDPGKQTNMTRGGVEVTSDLSGLYEIDDIQKVRMIQGESVEGFVSSALIETAREFIAGKDVEVSAAYMGDLDNTKAYELLNKIAAFKHAVEGNGRYLAAEVTKKIEDYGLRMTKVQIEHVSLAPEVEAAAQRIVSEALEAGGLTKDAKNKSAVAKALLQTFIENGVDLSKLDKAAAAEYIDRNLDRALAIEGKGSVRRINFGGQPPRGMIINPEGDNQP